MWALIPSWLPISSMILGKLFNSLCLSLLICKTDNNVFHDSQDVH